VKYHYSHRRFTYRMVGERRAALFRAFRDLASRASSVSSDKPPLGGDPSFRDISQVGSLAGAAYLLNHNAGVLKASSE